jgi:8-oxo-dGDP phosphatase
MFECMFDRLSQHPPTDTVKKRGRPLHTTGTHVATGSLRLAFSRRRHHPRVADPQLSRPNRGRDTGCVPFIERVASREVYRNPWLVLREDDIRRPDGSHGIYSVVDKPTYALVMPYDGQRFQLVEQFRYPLGARRWEFPQGTAPGLADLEPAELAARELREETGLRATSFEALGMLDVAAGMSSQRGWVFLATGISEGDSDREHEEQDMRSEWFAREDVEEMIRSGVLADAQSVAAYGLFLLSDR